MNKATCPILLCKMQRKDDRKRGQLTDKVRCVLINKQPIQPLLGPMNEERLPKSKHLIEALAKQQKPY